MAFRKSRRVNLGRVAVFAVFAAAFVQSAFAGTYGGGGGEPNDPYLIYTPEQMNQIGLDPNNWNKHFKLMADPNLSCYTGTQFNRIGTDYDHPFTGTFDGNSHIISNFTYTAPTTRYVGLFGYVGSGGQIKNLGLINVNVTGQYDTGGLVGYNNGTITNSYATGTVTGSSWDTGGLVGYNNGTITNSYATGNVTGYYYTGGLVGYNSYGTITDCSADGSVNGRYPTGGLVGDNGGTIINCYATGTVTGQGDCTGGGLVGYTAPLATPTPLETLPARATAPAAWWEKTTAPSPTPTPPEALPATTIPEAWWEKTMVSSLTAMPTEA
jgi:hypothetical protein